MKKVIINVDDNTYSLEGFGVIPSTKESKFEEPYFEKEVANYTTNFDEWMVYINTINNLEFSTVVSFIEEFGGKFKHFALAPVFKIGTEKLYEVKTKHITQEEIDSIMNGEKNVDDIVLLSLNWVAELDPVTSAENNGFKIRYGVI